MIGTAITSIISFAGTNIDDIFILLILFSQVGTKIKRKHIVIGQYLGIGILVAISLLGAFGLQFVPQEYVGILGIIPIVLGGKAWIDYKKEKQTNSSNSETDTQQDLDSNIQEVTNTFGNQEINDNSVTNIAKKHKRIQYILRKGKAVITTIIKPEILSVMLVTMANGADNIGIYIPLFASYTVWQLIVAILIFAVMTAIWCILGERLANLPAIKNRIQKYKHILVPIVFIGLGIYIIVESGVISAILSA